MSETPSADNPGSQPSGLPLNDLLGLLPIGPHDHPDPHTTVWSGSELRAIKTYAARCVAAERERRAKKPLTAQQLDKMIKAFVGSEPLEDNEYSAMVMFATAVERAHGIGA